MKNAFIALLKGLGSKKRVEFVNYPIGKYRYSERFKGRLVLVTKKCTACKMCHYQCPAKCITVVKDNNSDSPKKFELDLTRCAFCHLCVEVCPNEALIMTDDYANAGLAERQWVLGIQELSKRRSIIK